MRGMLALILVLIFAAPQTAAAIFYNDSDVINIGDGEPPAAPEGQGDPGSGGGGGDTGGLGNSSGAGGSGTSGSGGSSSSGGGGSSGGASSGGSSSGGGSGSSAPTPPSDDDLVNALTTSGALDGISSGQSGALGGSWLERGGGESLSISIDGDKVRSSFRASDLRDALKLWSFSKAGAGFGEKDYGLMAASTALSDSRVQAISLTASKFEITYRSRGYLFVVIPISFPVRVAVTPSASNASDRVQVRLPWYQFFVREFFTKGGLASDVDAVIRATIEMHGEEKDIDARLFTDVAKFLKQKIGTVADTVIIGGTAQ